MQIEGWNGEVLRADSWTRALTFGLLTGAVLGVIGPFGLYHHPLPLRVLHQCAATIGGTGLAGLLIPLQLRVGLRAGFPRPLILPVAILATAVPIAVVVSAVSALFWGERVAGIAPDEWYVNALLMLTISLFLWFLLELARHGWSASPFAIQPREEPAAEFRASEGDVLCLQVEDNYVRVHKPTGSALELMSLRAAIARFGSEGGLQVHRSYWVSDSALDSAEYRGRNLVLILRNGIVVPVARNRVPDVRGRGWLARLRN